MMRWLASLVVVMGIIFFAAPQVYAEPALGVQPLQYAETLKKGERKKAYIDISNPTMQPVAVKLSVQAFKQVDDKGTLSFYDDQKISNGILLDYQEVEIPAKKALRLYFIVDGTKLPTGDVFAAIFAQTKPDQGAGAPAVRVGTLLILTNETPGARQAAITQWQVPTLQFGTSLDGQLAIKNTAPAVSASGFFPTITVTMWPFGSTTEIKGPLLYAGNTRTVPFHQPSNQIGLYKLTASIGTSRKDAWVVVVTGVWRWVSGGIIALLVGGVIVLLALRRRRSVI